MAREVAGLIELQIKSGATNPSLPIDPALGSRGTNIMGFYREFNARTRDKAGRVSPVVITYYNDKSFSFIIKTPPAAAQLMEAAKVKDGSREPNRREVASVTWERVRTIAENKMPGLNCFAVKNVVKLIAGTACGISITVKRDFPSK